MRGASVCMSTPGENVTDGLRSVSVTGMRGVNVWMSADGYPRGSISSML